MTRRACRAAGADPAHRFVCAECRAEARMAAAWEAMRGTSPEEVPSSAGEPFVARVVDAARRDRARVSARKLWLAAAAALLFSFFAGVAQERSAADAARPSPEESYVALSSPDTLGELIPN